MAKKTVIHARHETAIGLTLCKQVAFSWNATTHKPSVTCQHCRRKLLKLEAAGRAYTFPRAALEG